MRTGRAVAAEANDFGHAVQERKVRTPQGSEPANGGAWKGSKDFSATTSATESIPAIGDFSDLTFGILSNRRVQFLGLESMVMGEMVRPERA